MTHALEEIRGQPASWRSTIPSARDQWAAIAAAAPPAPNAVFLFVGSGSSLYLAQTAAQSFQEVTGRIAVAVPSSEIFLSAASTVPTDVPVVAFVISRSGNTSEAVLAAEYLGRNCRNATVVGVTCTPDSSLASAAPHTLSLPHAAEKSVVMTRSFTSMLIALQVVAACVANDAHLLEELMQLPDLLDSSMPEFEAFAEALGSDLQQRQYIYLGLGPYRGLAEEATLKLKEMTQTPCEAYNPLEFRHGPVSIVTDGTVAVLLESHRDRDYLPDLAHDLREHGARVVTLGANPTSHAGDFLQIPGDLSDVARAALYLPPLQFVAYDRAVALGLNPDQPRHLTQVVMLDRPA